MSRRPLKPRDKSDLSSASRQKIESYFVDLKTKSNGWIVANNRYRTLCISQYEDDFKNGSVSQTELIGYVAASGPAHVIDGWSLLSRAVTAAFRGDTYSSVHLAYYAELRAAASLLGSEGIGVFNSRHPVIDCNGLTLSINGRGTHDFVWQALDYWATLSSAADLINISIRPEGIGFRDWLSVAGSPPPIGALAKLWFTQWGVDLSHTAHDHSLRNLISYRPSEFRPSTELDALVLAQFIEELWGLLQPGSSPRFPSIESHLLRLSFQQSGTPSPTQQNLQSLGLNPQSAAAWSKFLAQPSNPMPLRLAERTSQIEDPECHLQIISRASLLLYMATLATRRLLTNASYSAENLRFYWQRLGTSRGLWDASDTPTDPIELWADIESCLGDVRAWREASTSPVSLRQMRHKQHSNIDRVVDFELAGMWGLLP